MNKDYKILIADDELMVLRTIEFRLQREGYKTIVAFDGKEAIEKIFSESPDLIITDLMMPYNNGLEIVNVVRNQLKQKTPVIILSAVGLEKTVLEAFKLGADDFVTKPFSPNELTIRVEKLLSKLQYSL